MASGHLLVPLEAEGGGCLIQEDQGLLVDVLFCFYLGLLHVGGAVVLAVADGLTRDQKTPAHWRLPELEHAAVCLLNCNSADVLFCTNGDFLLLYAHCGSVL